MTRCYAKNDQVIIHGMSAANVKPCHVSTKKAVRQVYKSDSFFYQRIKSDVELDLFSAVFVIIFAQLFYLLILKIFIKRHHTVDYTAGSNFDDAVCN